MIFNKFSTNKPFIDRNGKLFGKFDLFLPLLIIILVVLGFFISKVLLQKDTYIEVELFASGGEWWWNNPDPPYWLTDPIQPGAVEYDPQGNKLVEILNTQKFEVGDRKMLWMKARLRVAYSPKSKQYRFRRDPIQIGSLIYVAPNNVKINSSVMWIKGIGEERKYIEKIVTLKQYDTYPWHADAVSVGDVMKDDNGKVWIEVLDKQVVPAEVMTVDDKGVAHASTNPLKRDLKIKMKMRVIHSKSLDYVSYFQPLKIGFHLFVPLNHANISGQIIKVE